MNNSEQSSESASISYWLTLTSPVCKFKELVSSSLSIVDNSLQSATYWFRSWFITDEDNLTTSRSFDSLSSPLTGFAKFEEKKRHQTDRKSKSFRSVFRKSPTPSPSESPELRGSSKDRLNSATLAPHHPGSPKISPHKPQDSEKDQVRNEINTFLSQFPKQIVHDVVVKVKQCEAELSRACHGGIASVEEISDISQDFYRNFKGKVDMVPCYQSMTAEDKETLMDLIEKYLTISLYKELFSPVSSIAEDEIKDLGLQNRYAPFSLPFTSTYVCFILRVILSALF